ncbi:hypothetical protein EDC04DRAFT_2698059, partial [Pisolithus marmoratus]
GYKKIIDACRQALKDDREWVWIDTCCIDKKSSPELSTQCTSGMHMQNCVMCTSMTPLGTLG